MGFGLAVGLFGGSCFGGGVSMVVKELSGKEKAGLFYKEYLELGSVHKVGKKLGCCHSTVHKYLKEYGYRLKGQKFSAEEDLIITNFYKGNESTFLDEFNLNELVEKLGGRSSKQNISRRAKQLGLTIQGRPVSDKMKSDISNSAKEWIKSKGHPKGFLGGSHTEKAKQAISKKSIANWKSMPEDDKAAMILKQLKTRDRNGTMAKPRPMCSWKQQWAEINGVKKFYRSRWELNYAYYLEWLRLNNQIKSWEHEPETFWFEGVKRGCMSYLPDFKVTENDGTICYHEVKGWMDDRSKTKLRRMAKYHPSVKMVLIDATVYRSIAKKAKLFIKEWQ